MYRDRHGARVPLPLLGFLCVALVGSLPSTPLRIHHGSLTGSSVLNAIPATLVSPVVPLRHGVTLCKREQDLPRVSHCRRSGPAAPWTHEVEMVDRDAGPCRAGPARGTAGALLSCLLGILVPSRSGNRQRRLLTLLLPSPRHSSPGSQARPKTATQRGVCLPSGRTWSLGTLLV